MFIKVQKPNFWALFAQNLPNESFQQSMKMVTYTVFRDYVAIFYFSTKNGCSKSNQQKVPKFGIERWWFAKYTGICMEFENVQILNEFFFKRSNLRQPENLRLKIGIKRDIYILVLHKVYVAILENFHFSGHNGHQNLNFG